jgi:sporulation-control protein spo0M
MGEVFAMSFLDKMKNAAGVGAAKIEVDLSQRPGKRGDELVALVRLIPGQTAQKVNFLGVNVEWEGDWSYKNADGATIEVRNGRGYVLMDRAAECNGVTLQPGNTIQIPVRVKIPSDAPMSGEKLKWKLYTRADIAEGADPEWSTSLDIRG